MIPLYLHHKAGCFLSDLEILLRDELEKYNTKSARKKSLELKCLAKIDALKCELDNLICRDFPYDFDGVYYGQNSYSSVGRWKGLDT